MTQRLNTTIRTQKLLVLHIDTVEGVLSFVALLDYYTAARRPK